MTDVQKKAVQFASPPPRMMGPKRGSVMRMHRCQESLARMSVNSNIFNKSFRVSGLKPADVKTGRVIGSGGFGQLKSVRNLFTSLSIIDTQDTGDDSSASTKGGSDSVTVTTQAERFDPRKYVMKEVRGSIDNTKVLEASIDLAKEARFLQSLSHHPNIVSFHSTGGTAGRRDFFILIEKLETTLEDLIHLEWNTLQRNIKNNAGLGYDLSKTPKQLKKEAEQNFLNMRLNFVSGICSGLAFLHENRVLFRDIKSSNIGITFDGTPQIFDFGLARELKEKDKADEEGNYNLTKMVGTLRYMASEVFVGQAYGLKSDVYSFAILFYEIMALEMPFKGMQQKEFCKYAHEKNKRPKMDRKWSKDIRKIMETNWDRNPSKRSTMDAIGEQVKAMIA